MTPTTRRTILYIVIVALAGIVLCVAFAARASANCYVCPAEPAPLPQLYLPLVQHMPPMSAEFTPAQPETTPEPDVELPLGDASQ